ncbi:hypothetical protein GOP47_0028706 [Adiantum capillus-veneris]|nr:hypothetical protein GOP47_0028706 [Adiantum capillus-veneris]
MGQPSNAKPPRNNSSLRPSFRRNGKASRKRNPNSNPNPNSRRRKHRSGKANRTQDHADYHPPRLQDLQFQNRLKAFSHFPERLDASAGAAYNHILDGSTPSASGFPAPTFNIPRGFLANARIGGLPQTGFDFPAAYTGSLVYPGKVPSFPVPNPRLISSQGQGVLFPGSLLFTGTRDAGLPPRPLRTFAVGSNDSGEASTSGAASGFPKSSSKGKIPAKRYKTFRRSHRAIAGAYKRLGAPAAPRNTTSFLMRAKKAGGITSFVSPSPAVTPAVLPTPVVSPFVPFVGLGDEANHEWGVDDYGSMNGLIRLRSLDLGSLDYGDNNDSESEVEQGAQSVQQLEQRLDHDVSRFVMTYPAHRHESMERDNLDMQRIGDQDSHIAHLEEENMDLKERLYSVQQEVEELRRRLRVLEGLSSSDEAEAEASPDRSVANVSCL